MQSKELISFEIAELLGIPKRPGRRNTLAYKIVGKVFETIVAGLVRGEDVKIQGFGIFRLHTLPARMVPNYAWHGKTWSKDYCPKRIEARTIVKFFPSKALIRFINEDQNATQS
jgi:nucleoid DNA-binding protein